MLDKLNAADQRDAPLRAAESEAQFFLGSNIGDGERAAINQATAAVREFVAALEVDASAEPPAFDAMVRDDDAPIRAWLHGRDTITCPQYGITVRSAQRVVDLCRRLVFESSTEIRASLDVYRNGALFVRVPSIAEAARTIGVGVRFQQPEMMP